MKERPASEHPTPFITPEVLGVVSEYRSRLYQPLDPGETPEDIQVRAGAYLHAAMERLKATDTQRALAFAAIFSETDAEFYPSPGHRK